MDQVNVNVNGIMIGFEAARWAESVGCDPAEDVRRVTAGEIDREGLLADCTDGAEESQEATIREYVSDVMVHVLRATPWRVKQITANVQEVQDVKTIGWFANLAEAMTAGEAFNRQHPNALLECQLGEDGVTHLVNID